MSTSPAFQFYPNDFVGGKPGMMTAEEIGIYVMLLCLDWNQNGFAYDVAQLARWCKVSPKRFAAAWVAIGECFAEREGRYYNARLDKEREKQQRWREKSSAGGKASAKQRATTLEPPLPTVVEPPHQPTGNIPFPSPDCSQTTKQHARAKKPRVRSAKPVETWLTPAITAWEKHNGAGSLLPGKAAGILARLKDAGIAPDEIGRRLGRYCAARKGGFCNLADFAEHHAEWATPDVPLMQDGWLTEEGERLTRPAGMKANPYGPLPTGDAA